MSALSKTFVVLVTILSVALVTLIVPHVANRQHYKKQISELDQARKAADITAGLRQKEITALNSRNMDKLSATLALVSKLSADFI